MFQVKNPHNPEPLRLVFTKRNRSSGTPLLNIDRAKYSVLYSYLPEFLTSNSRLPYRSFHITGTRVVLLWLAGSRFSFPARLS